MKPVTIPIAEGARAEGGGVCNFMSWHRLENALKQTGEVRPGECIEKVTIDGRGITFYYKQVAA